MGQNYHGRDIHADNLSMKINVREDFCGDTNVREN